jgi:hypothetical protein
MLFFPRLPVLIGYAVFLIQHPLSYPPVVIHGNPRFQLSPVGFNLVAVFSVVSLNIPVVYPVDEPFHSPCAVRLGQFPEKPLNNRPHINRHIAQGGPGISYGGI